MIKDAQSQGDLIAALHLEVLFDSGHFGNTGDKNNRVTYAAPSMIPLVRQVMHQARERLFKGNTHVPSKLVSLFEPHTEVICKGKASKPTEFGKMVKIQEAEAQIVTHYEVYGERPSDCDLLVPALAVHEELLGRAPYLVTADAAFFSQRNELAAQARGVRRVAIPNRSTKSAQRKQLEKRRWFRNAQKWRTGCEGRISLLKRRHGLNRCRYKGLPGIQRWVGLGVIADNHDQHRPRARPLGRTLTSTLPLPSYLPGRKAAADLPCLRPGRVSAEISQGHFCAGK